MSAKIINVVILLDVIGALASDSLENNIYLVDNNKNDGSLGEGTGTLKTKVEEGDSIMWTILPIECETYVAISGIEFENNCCQPVEENFEGSDINYWIGKVNKTPKEKSVRYKIKIKVGSNEKELITENTPSIYFDEKAK